MEYLLHGIEQGKNVTVIVTIKRRSLKCLQYTESCVTDSKEIMVYESYRKRER